MRKILKIGMIGAGRIAYVHIKKVNESRAARVTAIADPKIELARGLASEFDIPDAFPDYRNILEDATIDAVIVCSPTSTHADICMEAARAGKHIFCEKPVDQSVEKILETIDVIKKSGVKMQIGFNRRFDHNYTRIRDLARTGRLGDIKMVKITSREPESPPVDFIPTSGGLLLDMAIHDIDMARFQAGSEIAEVYAQGGVLVDPAIGEAGDIDTALMSLTFENGAFGVIECCRKTSYGFDQRVEVFGTKGMALADNDRLTNVQLAMEDGVLLDKTPFFFLERYDETFGVEIRAFIECVLEDRPVPVTIEDGLRPVVVAYAAMRSMKEHRPVRPDEILQIFHR